MVNYDWLLSGEAVDAVGAGRVGDASLKHSSRGWVTGWFQVSFQMHLDADDVPSSFYGVSFSLGACGVLLAEGGFLAVISWRGGSRLRDPVQISFQRR